MCAAVAGCPIGRLLKANKVTRFTQLVVQLHSCIYLYSSRQQLSKRSPQLQTRNPYIARYASGQYFSAFCGHIYHGKIGGPFCSQSREKSHTVPTSRPSSRQPVYEICTKTLFAHPAGNEYQLSSKLGKVKAVRSGTPPKLHCWWYSYYSHSLPPSKAIG